MINIIITVDRVESDIAVCIDDCERSLEIPVSFFESEPHDGDVFEISLISRPDLKKEISDEIGSLLERLKRKGEKKQ